MRGAHATPARRVGFWHWPRSTTAAGGARRRGSAASAYRSSGTGWCSSTQHGPEGLIDRKAPGPASKLNEDQRRALSALVESGPIPAVHGVVRWRLKDLAQWIWEELGICLSETTLSRELKALGFAKLSARSHYYAQSELVMEEFKKRCPPHWRRSGRVCWPVPR